MMNFAADMEDAEYRDRMRKIADDYDWPAMQRMRAEMQSLGVEKYSIEFYQRIAKEGLVGLSWPQPYGKGVPFIRAFLFAEELETQGFGGYALTTNQRGGGMLIRSGTDEQIRQHLPQVVNGTWRFCQGLSEPGAGSDLLSLKTRAVREGDEYIVNGSKLWTSNAHISDWTGLLVRTDPEASRHRGLSMLLVDLKSPGIEIQPVWVMGGWRVNAVFYDNVRVPAANLIGEEGKGWDVVTGNLDEERAMSFGGTETRALAVRLIHRLEGMADQLSETDLEKLGHFIMELEADRLLYLRVALAAGRGDDTSGIGPMSKVFGSELAQRFIQWAADVIGDEVLFADADGSEDVLASDMEEQLRAATVLTNIGGTSEVQRNIISNRYFKLPRAY
ncbi:acyl-CoA dehydrogenase family protein [Noviherbaspirillum sedimenti]|uniref:Acyl-CoA dehydrogenase n=1 Tax=Noviherbaspirillum sedimenti TaxID=2320865 RepID=A0A3A3G146_9BURK|nr:acyl-CoA dehydrogenase family protein [Noviherbaspirillum sedimenti]RJG00629.1 acyl-CoA dehydrogenase [Noviherbaspirillum sedimenti]